MSFLTVSLFRLRVIADADPGAIARVVERFHNLNVLPRRLSAEFGTDDIVHIEADVCGLTEEQIKVIAAKLRAVTCIVNAYWHRL